MPPIIVLGSRNFWTSKTFFPGGSDGKESACDVGDLGLIPGMGTSLGGGHGNPLQYSCLENPINRGAWRSAWGWKESDTTERLSTAHTQHNTAQRLIFQVRN